jgi:hypothetical protein
MQLHHAASSCSFIMQLHHAASSYGFIMQLHHAASSYGFITQLHHAASSCGFMLPIDDQHDEQRAPVRCTALPSAIFRPFGTYQLITKVSTPAWRSRVKLSADLVESVPIMTTAHDTEAQ